MRSSRLLLTIALDFRSTMSLQSQIRQGIIEAILGGALPPDRRIPSSRALARQLSIARNTVVLAYQQLVVEGYLLARPRSGLLVNGELLKNRRRLEHVGGPVNALAASEWRKRFRSTLEDKRVYRYPPGWQKYPYPFIEGRFDRSLFPIAEWREATRLALGVREVQHWATDTGEADDLLLIEQIRTKVLPRRGIAARPDEILITLGTQHALHLVSELFADRGVIVAMEDPGNIGLHDLLTRRGVPLVLQPVDEDGLVVDERLDKANLIYVTPSHQRPTGATLSTERRIALLNKAVENDTIVIEDDFDCETNYQDDDYPALKGMSGGERVIYVASLSRSLAPGLRLGFLVAPADVVAEARRLRSLTSRAPPLNNQRTAALFLSLGHYDTTMLRLGRIFRDRLLALRDALNHYLPQSIVVPAARSGTSYWIRGPESLDAEDLARAAEAHGVLIEPVAHYHQAGNGPRNAFRMSVTAIPAERIRDGVATLTSLMVGMRAPEIPHVDPHAHGWLKGDELRRAMQGATLLYKTVYSEPCTIELRPDGRMEGRAGYAGEDLDQGRWWVEGEFWCRQWDSWAYAEISKFRVRLESGKVRWFNENGRLIDSAVFVENA